MNYYQLAYLVLFFIGLGMGISNHGKEKKGTHNAWANVISAIIQFWIVYNAGIFSTIFK